MSNNNEYGGEWPTDEYPDAGPSQEYPEPYAYGFRRTIAQNAAETERREAVRAAAAPPSSPTLSLVPVGCGPQLPSRPSAVHDRKSFPSYPIVAIKLTHHLTDTPPQVQPCTPQGFTNPAPQNPQAGSAQDYGNAGARQIHPGGYGSGSYAGGSGYNNLVPTYANPVPKYAEPSSSTRLNSRPSNTTAATPAPTPPKRGRGRKINVKLALGFAWDQESLALLCHHKDRLKKGTGAAIASGEFPGKTVKDLEDIWEARRQEAREAWEALAEE